LSRLTTTWSPVPPRKNNASATSASSTP
jgi:hypothetical protein